MASLTRVALILRLRPLLSRSYSNISDVYDLIISGGGMVGAALACAVGQEPSLASKKILVLESGSGVPIATAPDKPFSNRVCTISVGSARLLKRLNAWDEIEQARARPFKRMYVWDACSNARISFSPQDSSELHFSFPAEQLALLGVEDIVDDLTDDGVLGYIVENNVILHALTQQLQCCPLVEVRRGVSISGMQQAEKPVPNPWLGVSLSNGDTVTTRLLIGADGTSSVVRQLAGFEGVGWSYGQSAVVATLLLDQAGDNPIAWQRFLPTGPIALLPLSDQMSSLVWSTTPSHAKQLVQMASPDFVDAVNSALFEEHSQNTVVQSANEAVQTALATCLPGSVPVRQLPPAVADVEEKSRGAFPLSLNHSPSYVRPRIALIGDSAHRVHPLAGLGVNLGFGDVVCLYQLLTTAAGNGEEWGSLQTLYQYETQRQRHNLPIMSVIDGLHRLFSTSAAPVVFLRSLGLQLTAAIAPIKEFIVSRAQKT